MNERLIKLLASLATDSRVLADYQNDPKQTRARFGVSKRELLEFIESRPGEQPSAQRSGVTPEAFKGPVTH